MAWNSSADTSIECSVSSKSAAYPGLDDVELLCAVIVGEKCDVPSRPPEARGRLGRSKDGVICRFEIPVPYSTITDECRGNKSASC